MSTAGSIFGILLMPVPVCVHSGSTVVSKAFSETVSVDSLFSKKLTSSQKMQD